MNKTKILALLLALTLALGLTACTSGSGEAEQASAAVSSAVSSAIPTAAETQAASAEPSAAADVESAPPSADAPAALTVTDMAGREVTLAAPAEKIVALEPSDCEVLYALGEGEKLVGRGEYCDYPAEISQVASVQSGSETNIEQIIALQPQLVVMTKMAQTVEQIEALENAGISVYVSDAQNIEGVYTNIALLGQLTGASSEAEAMVANMKAAFENVSAQAGDGEGKTVYFEVSPLEYGLWTAGSGTFMDEIAGMLGLTNAFADVAGWAEISEEQVIARDPDYIVTTAMYYGEGETPVEEIESRPGWQDLKAVKNGSVYNADANEITRPGPRLADAAKALYQFVYGE